MARKDIAILGVVRSGGDRPVPGAVRETVYPVDEDEENQVMGDDD